MFLAWWEKAAKTFHKNSTQRKHILQSGAKTMLICFTDTHSTATEELKRTNELHRSLNNSESPINMSSVLRALQTSLSTSSLDPRGDAGFWKEGLMCLLSFPTGSQSLRQRPAHGRCWGEISWANEFKKKNWRGKQRLWPATLHG